MLSVLSLTTFTAMMRMFFRLIGKLRTVTLSSSSCMSEKMMIVLVPAPGAQFLNETGAGTKTIIIFSDMQEELDKVTVRNFPISLKNIRIIALNVVKLKTDNVDPRRYLGRLDAWQKRVEGAGASEWRVINDLERLDAIFSKS